MQGSMINFGLVGAGTIGKVHAGCIARSDSARLRLVHDADPAAAESLGGAHGATAAALDELLADPEIDAVIIAAPTVAHGRIARSCADAGKAFLCEKPIDVGRRSAAATVRRVRETGVFGGMGFNRRHDAQHRELFDAISGGEAGNLEMMLFTSRTQALPDLNYISASGGQLRDKGAHFFDLACWLSNDRPKEIYADGACLIDDAFGEHGDCDTAMIIVRMSKGAFCHFNFSRRTTYGYDERIEVFGSGGRLESRAPLRHDLVRYKGDRMISVGLHQVWIDRMAPSYDTQLAAFIEELRNPTGSFPTVEDGFVAEAIAETGELSMKERASVEIDLTV